MPNPNDTSKVDPASPPPDYMAAILALWAGDQDTATSILSASVKAPLRRVRRAEAFSIDPVGTSALRTLEQVRRRISEFRRLKSASGMADSEADKLQILVSERGHLAGAIWSESDREFELRAYVKDLTWESEFYRAARLLHTEATIRSSEINSPSPRDDKSLNLSWSIPGELFMLVYVSDFCTFIVRATWTSLEMPSRPEEISDVFQLLLDKFETAVAPDSDAGTSSQQAGS